VYLNPRILRHTHTHTHTHTHWDRYVHEGLCSNYMQDPFGWGHISSILWYARRIQMVDILFSPFPSSTWTETMCKKGTVGRWLHFTYCKCFERQDTYPLTHICYSWTYSCYLLTYHRWPLVERFSLYTLLNAVQSGSRLILAKQGPKYTSRTPVIQWFEDSCFVWNANGLVPFQPFGLSGATHRVLETSSNKRCKEARRPCKPKLRYNATFPYRP